MSKMKKIIPIFVLLTLITSCEERKPLKQPFVIIKIEYISSDNDCYTYQDANGNTEYFITKRFQHKVGDTL